MQNSGIAWFDIQRMVKEEKKQNNPLANLIYKLNLDKNQVTLILDAATEEDDGNNLYANFDPVVKVDVDINITA
jgi:hypothetical protein